ncbi:MAG: metallophosphoesterase [Ruminococcaceae bacterium]|nr:metallophosphoesterase [Oscillospiraceae bacterium]
MKILVFSDSHLNTSNMTSIINHYKGEISLIVHLGDMYSDFEKIKIAFPNVPTVAVKGNNDFFEVVPESEVFSTFAGVKCFFTHGHRYNVKGGLAGISVRARALNADLVLFGHTHLPLKETRGKTLFINPGTVGTNYGKATFALIELDNSSVVFADIMSFDTTDNSIDVLRNLK